MFPPEFAASVDPELGAAGAEALLSALDGPPVVSVRYNPYKMDRMPAGSDPVPWCRYGAYLSERPVFTLDPTMHAGAYYVQEASSQFVEHVFREAVGSPEGLRVLDLCAAPGGKTTLYSTLVGPSGLVVANDVVKTRASVLADNVRRWGIGNVAVTCNEPAALGTYRHFFDVVAVDAPCSGEGMFRRLPESRAEWSMANVEMCAARQKRILADVWNALRPGGVLIYSTCTFNRRENEDNVAWLLENFDVEPLPIEMPEDWGVETSLAEEDANWRSPEPSRLGARRGDRFREISVAKEARPQCSGESIGKTVASDGASMFRLYPHKLRGEGFFVAVMRKGDGRLRRDVPRARREVLSDVVGAEKRLLEPWIEAPEAMKFSRVGDNCYAYYRPQYQSVAALAGGLNVIYSGVCMGQLFGGKLRPDHALALSVNLARNVPDHNFVGGKNFATTELPLDAALDYLRKKEFADVGMLAEGLNLLTYNDLPIGWTKRIGHRTNTLLPNSFRIVNL